MYRIAHRRTTRGFTLIELMIVVTIIAILAAIMIPNFIRARAQGQLTACKSNLKNLATACEMYAADNNGAYPVDQASLLSKLTTSTGAEENYMQALPTCPSSGANYTYSVTAGTATTKASFKLYCSGTNHAAVGISTSFPQYTLGVGLVENTP